MESKIILSFLLTLGFFSVHGQLVSDSVQIEGNVRTFHFKKPAGKLKNGSLVFVLHGSGGTGMLVMGGAAKLENIAAQENVILVYPDGYKKYWNECRKTAPTPPNIENINENAFFASMINYFEQRYGVSEKKVFVVGTSGGGHMAYKLAITMPERFKAITAIIANLPDTNNMDCAERKLAVPVMIINGTDDKTNPYGGGEVISGGVNLGYVRSTDRTFEYWSSLAGYSGTPVQDSLPDTDPSDGKRIVKYTFKQPGKPEVVLLKVIGGKHDYPNDIDVYLEAWNFFKRQ